MDKTDKTSSPYFTGFKGTVKESSHPDKFYQTNCLSTP
jgi:hypothetical protein